MSVWNKSLGTNGRNKTNSFEQHIEKDCSYYSGAIIKHVKEVNKYFRNHHKA